MVESLNPPSLFLDASALIVAVFSKHLTDPGRKMLAMGETNLIDLHVSNLVVREVERVLTYLDPNFQPINLAENLVMANVARVADSDPATVALCLEITRTKTDAAILAGALDTNCEVLVVNDKASLLRNSNIGPQNTRTVVMALDEAEDWARDQVMTRARLRQQDRDEPRKRR